MTQFCGTHRLPRAGIDRIVDAEGALAVVRLALSSPPVAETVVVVLDDDRRGRTIVVVDATEDDDSVIEIVERLTEAVAVATAGGGERGAIVVATVRLGRGPDDDDADRWLEASDLAECAGVELLEWFVLETDGMAMTAWCPRDLLAEPPRWRS